MDITLMLGKFVPSPKLPKEELGSSADTACQVERRGGAVSENEGSFSKSSTPSLAQRRCNPRSLEPIVFRCSIALVSAEAR
jgi:hypothetical protein